MLKYKEFKPTKKLAQFIECYWEMNDTISNNQILQECLVPGGRAEIIFTNTYLFWFGTDKLGKPIKYSGSFLLGQRNSFNYIGLSGDINFIGIRFKQGCQALFKISPANKFTNKLIPLQEIYGLNLKTVIEPILNSKNSGDKKKHIEKWLLGNFTSTSLDWQLTQNCISKITSENFESISIKELFESYGWQYKKAERTFLKYTGYTPQKFINIIRFKKVLEENSSEQKHLTKMAYNFGFYDQSHFIREFYNYAGEKPSSFYKKPSQLAALLFKIKL